VYDKKTKKEVYRREEFHIVCGKVPGRNPEEEGKDPKNVCSKNGPNPIERPGKGGSFEPKPTKPSPTQYNKLENMKRECYCCPDDNKK